MNEALKDGRLPNRFHELYLVEVCRVAQRPDGVWDSDEMVGTVMVDEVGYFAALRSASDTFKRLHPEFQGEALSLGVLVRTGVFATH
jgi:hypothetical protein